MIFLTLSLALLLSSAHSIRLPPRVIPNYNEAPEYINRNHCTNRPTVHIATTLDYKYLRGSIASVHSIVKNAACPENARFHFITTSSTSIDLSRVIESTFPKLRFKTYPFENEKRVRQLISSSIRPALEEPLNYARIYLSEILDTDITRVVYLDSDTIVVDDIEDLWSIELSSSRVIGAPEYCHANFTNYFNREFWDDLVLSRDLKGKKPCYFNTGVMVMDLGQWQGGEYTIKMEKWMEIQKNRRIYELGSLPPFMLVFGGDIEGIDHRWNQHGLGGDNVVNSCRSLHPGRVSLMHWSGKGKPWVRLDEGRGCPVDHLWKPYDLYRGMKRS